VKGSQLTVDCDGFPALLPVCCSFCVFVPLPCMISFFRLSIQLSVPQPSLSTPLPSFSNFPSFSPFPFPSLLFSSLLFSSLPPSPHPTLSLPDPSLLRSPTPTALSPLLLLLSSYLQIEFRASLSSLGEQSQKGRWLVYGYLGTTKRLSSYRRRIESLRTDYARYSDLGVVVGSDRIG
jgi:hypothetical protein